jgi:hypothetical protein
MKIGRMKGDEVRARVSRRERVSTEVQDLPLALARNTQTTESNRFNGATVDYPRQSPRTDAML